jgi:PAS domain-containing protein
MATETPPVGGFLRALIDAMPVFVLAVDEDVRILDYNRAVAALLSAKPEQVLRHRGGEVLHCLHSSDVPEGCGRAPYCADCVVRNSVNAAFAERRVVRQRATLELQADNAVTQFHALITASPFVHDGGRFVLLVIEDVNALRALQKIVPICAKCKQIRNDKGFWAAVDEYFHVNMDLDFSHGLCPKCAREAFAELERR